MFSFFYPKNELENFYPCQKMHWHDITLLRHVKVGACIVHHQTYLQFPNQIQNFNSKWLLQLTKKRAKMANFWHFFNFSWFRAPQTKNVLLKHPNSMLLCEIILCDISKTVLTSLLELKIAQIWPFLDAMHA